MPKYGIHEIVLSRAINALTSSSNPTERQTGNEMNSHRGLAMLGAIGPDIFFWAPDYTLVDKFYRLYTNIDKIVDAYREITRPFREVKDAVGEATEAVVGSLAPSTVDLIKHLINEIKETTQLFKATVSTGLFAGVLNITDFISEMSSLPSLSAQFFNQFVPPFQNQMKNQQLHDVTEWYWFDMLHYRRTGRFARELVNSARTGSARQRAYAFGYLSHVSTDVVGHGFVNQVVGAPYRLNVQRHVTVENYMDVWAYNRYYQGENVAKTSLTRLGLPNPNQLPNEIVDLLDGAFRTTYSDLYPTRLGDPGFLSKAQIKQTYEIFYKVMEIIEKMVVDRPEEPFSGVVDILSNALDDLLEPPPSPPDPPSDLTTCSWGDILSFGLTSSSRDCYEEFFEQAGQWMEYVGELLLWTFETMLDLLDLILATILALPISALLALLYGIQLLLYQFYQQCRSVLAQNGFSLPDPDDITNSTGRALTTTFLGCGTPFKYPNLRNDSRSHLVCPNAGIETPVTAPDFYSYSNEVNSTNFIENVTFSLNTLTSYSQASTPSETVQLERQSKQIGNAIDFTKWMISVAANTSASVDEQNIVYANWNLDGDRGYGYKTWNGKLSADQLNVESESYVE